MCKLQWLGQLKSGDVTSLPFSEIYGSHMSISIESSAFYFESVGWKSAQSTGLGIQQLVMRSTCIPTWDVEREVLPYGYNLSSD